MLFWFDKNQLCFLKVKCEKCSRKQMIICAILLILIFLAAIAVGIWLAVSYYKDWLLLFEVRRDVQKIGDRTLTVNTINGKLRAPAIHVRNGDWLRVRVTNKLTDHGLSIHWHGFDMKGNQEFDGVVGLTQCAILPGESFVYDWKVDEQPGTYWYHSHSHMEPSGQNYIRGPLIVYEADAEIDSVLDMTDKYQVGNEIILFYRDLYPNYIGYDFPLSMGSLTKGAGETFDGTGAALMKWSGGTLNGEVQHAIKIQNGKYRFRIINGNTLNALYFSIDGYKLSVVATDGYPVEPFEADVVQIHIAERYDVVVNFNITTPTENVWIRAMTPTVKDGKQHHGIFGILKIRMNETVDYSDKLPTTKPVDMKKAKILNCAFFTKPGVTPEYDCHSVTELVSLVKRDLLEKFENHTVDFYPVFSSIGGLFFSLNRGPKTQNVIPTNVSAISHQFSEKDLNPHSLMLSIPSNKSVTIVVRNPSYMSHPIHLHGHHFEILEIGGRKKKKCTDDLAMVPNNAQCPLLDLENDFSLAIEELMKRPKQGVLKDTVIMPAAGAVVLRINTDNPGVWFMHCHYEMHLLDGMGFMVNEGEFAFTKEIKLKDYPSCDLSGKLQELEMETCDCFEDNDLKKGYRMNKTMKCSRSYLCRKPPYIGLNMASKAALATICPKK